FVALALLPVIYVILERFFNVHFGLSINLGYDWLAYYGSIIASLITLRGIEITLREQNEQYKKEQINSVRPILNITTDFDRMESLGEETIPSQRILYMTSSDGKLKYTNFIDLKEQNTSDNDTNSILIKINNIGLGHALLEEVKCTNNNCNHKLKPDEKFMIDKGTSNILLIRFDGELKGEEIVEFTLRDILDNKYSYKMKLVPTVEKNEDQGKKDDEEKPTFKKIEVQRNIDGEEELFILVKLDNAYFEEYFPELL
ncbi:MAG: hypothetical protein ACLUAW_03635, partial [Streptococcus salivarius]